MKYALATMICAALLGCEHAATQVVVVIDSDMQPGVELRRVRVRLGRVGAPMRFYDRTFEVRPRVLGADGTEALDGVLIPGEIAVTTDDPNDPRQLQVDVVASLRDETGSFTQSVTVPFERETVRYLSMFLAGRCRIAENRVCPAGQVCSVSGCAPVASLLTETSPTRDASAPRDVPPVPCTPGAAERCYDGVDNNCDGRVDEGCAPQSCADGGLGFEDVHFVTDAPERYNSHCASELVTPGAPFSTGETDAGAVTVSPFRIDRYEVTVARFRQYARAQMPAPPYDRVQYPAGVILSADLRPDAPHWPVVTPTAYAPANRYCHWFDGTLEREDQPLNCVDWFTAQAFCVWDGGRLPTEAEWEYVARHLEYPDVPSSYTLPVPRSYPWGTDETDERYRLRCDFNFDEPDCTGAVARDDVQYGTWSVTHSAHLQPWYRVFDLAGNVSEWTADVFNPDLTDCPRATSDPRCARGDGTLRFSVRGGGYQSLRNEVRATAREGVLSSDKRRTVGFRCVRAQ